MTIFVGDRLMLETSSEEIVEVKLFFPDIELIEGLGYINRDFVYIYKGEAKRSKLLPGLYTKTKETKKGNVEKEFIFVGDEEDGKFVFGLDKVVVLDINKIFENLNKEPESFMTTEDLESVSIDREVFVPIIRESDDFLKCAIKKAIIAKKINVKQKYKNKFSEPYQLTNRVHQLKDKTKMSTLYFMDWVELLDLDWKLILSDNGNDPANPIGEDIVIDGNDF